MVGLKMLVYLLECLDNPIIQNKFCENCPEIDNQQPDVDCPVNFDMADPKCFRNSIYESIVNDFESILEKLKGAHLYDGKNI